MAGKKKVLINVSNELIESTNLSGDDLTLLNYCREQNHKIISFTNKKYIVTTKAPSTLGEFFKQRLRWGQKTGINSLKTAAWKPGNRLPLPRSNESVSSDGTVIRKVRC